MNLFLKILLLSIVISPVLISQEYKPENKRKAEDLVNSVIKKQKTEEGAKSTDNSKQTEEIIDLSVAQKCALVRKFKETPYNYLSIVTEAKDIQNLIAKYYDEYEMYSKFNEKNGGHDRGNCAVFSPCGNYLACSGSLTLRDSYQRIFSIKIFNIQTKKCVADLKDHNKAVFSIVYSPCGNYLASSSDGIRIWNIKDTKLIADLVDRNKKVYELAFSPCGNYLAAGFDDGVRIWNIKKLIFDKFTTLSNLEYYQYMAFLTYGINHSDIKESKYLEVKKRAFDGLSVKYSPCGKYIASSSIGEIRICNTKDFECIASIKGYDSPGNDNCITSIEFSPCGRYLVFGEVSGLIKFWDIEEKKCTAEFEGHIFGIHSLGYSPCTNYLASGSWNGLVKIWDIGEGECIADLKDHDDYKEADEDFNPEEDDDQNYVESVVYSPCSNYIAFTYLCGGLKIFKRKYSQLLGFCAYCAKKQSMGHCPICRNIYYCSPECYKLDWQRHKELCLPRTASS